MARYRLTTIVVLLALALCCAVSPAAIASSTLLSGYGGPGQGNQAILGSTLIGGGAGGSGGGGSGTGTPAGTAASLAVEEAHGSSGARAAGGGKAGKGGVVRASRGASPQGSETLGRAVDTLAVKRVDAPALGLGGGDVAYIVLAFLVLALTALLSVLVMRRGPADRAAGEG
jgi:hypothetical protein